MNSLVTQRCFNHAQREAVARCPQCRHFLCRECVTEHDDRVICAACLGQIVRARSLSRRTLAGFLHAGGGVLGLLAAWFFFYLVGEGLLKLPASFHEGTLWQTKWWEE